MSLVGVRLVCLSEHWYDLDKRSSAKQISSRGWFLIDKPGNLFQLQSDKVVCDLSEKQQARERGSPHDNVNPRKMLRVFHFFRKTRFKVVGGNQKRRRWIARRKNTSKAKKSWERSHRARRRNKFRFNSTEGKCRAVSCFFCSPASLAVFNGLLHGSAVVCVTEIATLNSRNTRGARTDGGMKMLLPHTGGGVDE